MIAFFVNGTYTGGLKGGDAGLVVRVVFDGSHWNLFTAGGWMIRGDQVYQVQPVDQWTGFLGDYWYVQASGLDGHGYRYHVETARLVRAGVRVDAVHPHFAEPLSPRPISDDVQPAASRVPLAALPADQRAHLAAAYHVPPEALHAFATGQWTPETWDAVWHSIPVTVPPVPRPTAIGTRVVTTVHGVRGPQDVKAWLYGPFAIHRPLAARGYSLTHRASGHKILSRIRSREDARVLAVQLNPLSDWSVPTIPPADLHRVRESGLLEQTPRAPSFRAPLRNPFPETEEE
jgi:hypothetical protein